MTFVERLLLGSAAGFVAVAGASAADLPSRRAAPVDFVKICDVYGAGFFYIPGTDTCLRVSGRVRGEYAYIPAANKVGVTTNSFPTATKATGGTPTFVYNVAPSYQVAQNALDQSGVLARTLAILDARTQTAFGTARTYIAIRAENKTGLYADNGPIGAVVGGQAGGAVIQVEQALIQFAGFSFGRTSDNFSFMPAYNYITHFWSGFPIGISQLTYTAAFSGGVSATVSLEDRGGLNYSSNPTGLYNGVSPNPFAAGGSLTLNPAGQPVLGRSVAAVNGPYTWPELVGNVRIDQAWGAVQIMGSVLENSAVITGANTYFAVPPGLAAGFTGGSPITPTAGAANSLLVTGGNAGDRLTRIGYAFGAGVKINLPMIAQGDVLNVMAAYTNGDLDHLTSSTISDRTGNIGREFTGLTRVDRNLYVFPGASCLPNAVGGTAVATAGAGANSQNSTCTASSEQTRGFDVGGIFTHYWTPSLRSNLLASYISLTPGTRTQNTDWVLGGLSKMNAYEIGTSLVYSAAKDFDIGLEITYAKLNQRLTGQNGAAPTTVYVASNATTTANAGNNLGLPTNVVATPVLPFRTSPNMIQTRLRAERTF